MTMGTRKNSNSDALESHARGLGAVFANLQSLEFVLRLFLYRRRSRPHAFFRRGQNLTGLSVGAVLPENAVTDYDSLSDLITRYNTIARRSFAGFEIDHTLVTLRDALAHGRVFLPKTGLELRLLKFTRPRHRKVRVNFAAALTVEWLAAQNARVVREITKIHAAANAARQRRTP